jgi:hypothetical protein
MGGSGWVVCGWQIETTISWIVLTMAISLFCNLAGHKLCPLGRVHCRSGLQRQSESEGSETARLPGVVKGPEFIC